MRILHHGTNVRGVVVCRPMLDGTAPRRRDRGIAPRAPSAPVASPTMARTLASLLVLAIGLFYSVVAVQGVAELLGPPPEMVTTADERGDPVRTAQTVQAAAVARDGSVALLLRPLALTGAALAGLLLLWSGARGLRFRGDQRRWRSRQVTALAGCGAGALAFALGIGAAGGSAAAYIDTVWNGLEPVRPTAVVALVIAAITLLVPARGQGRGGRNETG